MFKSGNDAAIAIAEELGGSVEGFAKIMNDYAKSLGLVCSHYETPHGLDSAKHYSSAYDLAILTSKAMENEFFREICGEKTIAKDKYNFTRDYQNINKILWKMPTANGVKTGYTGQAGKCLVSSVKHGDRNIIIVVLNCHDRWNQTEKIYNYVENNYAFKKQNTKELVQSSQLINLGSIIQDSDFDYGFKGEATIDLEVFKPMAAVEKGDVLGKISLNENGDEKLKKDIRSSKEISKEAFERIIFKEENKEK
jgi:D-alanyl-D-alanine carboxypeptidase